MTAKNITHHNFSLHQQRMSRDFGSQPFSRSETGCYRPFRASKYEVTDLSVQSLIPWWLQSLDPKITATRNLIQEMDRLRNGIVSQVTVVQQCRGNTEAISNQFRTIIDALRSVEAFYAQVIPSASSPFLRDLK